MKNTNELRVLYTKSYIDDTGKNIPNLFPHEDVKQISTKILWENTIDAFYNMNNSAYFTCLSGDIRIVIAIKQTDEEGASFRFKQYYLSEMDGKTIFIPTNTWYGFQSMNNRGVVVCGITGTEPETTRLPSRIFNWHIKTSRA